MKSINNLEGKVALIKGSSSGIGLAVATELAARGAHVIVHGRDQVSVDQAIRQILNQGGQATPAVADTTNWEELQKLHQNIEAQIGPIDIVFANAGGSFSPPAPLANISPAEWDLVIGGNLTATFLTLKAFLPGMRERGCGSVITMASSAGRHIDNRVPFPYGVAKAGIVHLTQALATEAGPVRINCIAPDTIMTERNKQRIPTNVQADMVAAHPLKRLGSPQDIGQLIAFLASDGSSWISGAVFDITGGMVW